MLGTSAPHRPLRSYRRPLWQLGSQVRRWGAEAVQSRGAVGGETAALALHWWLTATSVQGPLRPRRPGSLSLSGKPEPDITATRWGRGRQTPRPCLGGLRTEAHSRPPQHQGGAAQAPASVLRADPTEQRHLGRPKPHLQVGGSSEQAAHCDSLTSPAAVRVDQSIQTKRQETEHWQDGSAAL